MSGKKVSIDQKLSAIYEFICEKEENNLIPENSKEMEGFKGTIDYLKDYAKLQTIAKSMSDKEGLKDNIESAQEDFRKLIEEKKEQIKNMPRPTKKSKDLYVYDLGESLKEAEERKYKEACDKRNQKILSLKEDIRIYQDKIRKLETLKKSFSKPDKLMEILFPEEYTNVKSNYARLVNLCVSSMTDGFSKNDLIGDDKIFKFDGENYKVNYNNARRFLSIIKSKKELLSAAEYITLKNDAKTAEGEFKKSNKKYAEYKNAYKMTYTNEFETVTDIMNNITFKYNDLYNTEEKSFNGKIARFKNRIRGILHLSKESRETKKIQQKREDLCYTIEQFVAQVKQDEKLHKAFDAYQIASKSSRREYFNNLQELEWAIHEIKVNGAERVKISPYRTNVEDLRDSVRSSYKMEEATVKESYEDAMGKIEKCKAMKDKLSSKTKKIIETQKSEDILQYAKDYYGFGVDREDDKFKYRDNMYPSGAAIILESILGRKNISWESIMDNYANVLGKHNLENERFDMDKTINSKVDSLKESLIKMVQVEREEEER